MNQALSEPAVLVFVICAGLLVIKMQLMTVATTILRNVRGVYLSPEDYRLFGQEPKPPDELIERVRRAHQNDLENILPFLAIGFLYALSGPSYSAAWWLCVVFTAARMLHTLTYIAGLQPWRSIFFGIASLALTITTILLLLRVV